MAYIYTHIYVCHIKYKLSYTTVQHTAMRHERRLRAILSRAEGVVADRRAELRAATYMYMYIYIYIYIHLYVCVYISLSIYLYIYIYVYIYIYIYTYTFLCRPAGEARRGRRHERPVTKPPAPELESI